MKLAGSTLDSPEVPKRCHFRDSYHVVRFQCLGRLLQPSLTFTLHQKLKQGRSKINFGRENFPFFFSLKEKINLSVRKRIKFC